MGGEEQGSSLAREDLRFEEAAKIRSGESVETPRGLVEQKDLWLVKKRAQKAEALNGAGGKRAHLTVERAAEFKLFGGSGDSCAEIGVGKVIQAAKEAEIFASRQAWIETQVGSGMIAEIAADSRRLANRVEAGDAHAAAGGKKKRGENAE